MATSQSELKDLLVACTLRLDSSRGPQGTAFFVAPGYALTAAHVVDGVLGTRVQLQGRAALWEGHVQESQPASTDPVVAAPGLYPAPDIALIHVDDGPPHRCVLLGTQEIDAGSQVMVYGHSSSAGIMTLTAESEYFTVTGELETGSGGCTLLKLGLGQAVAGMSGAPVLSLATGEVIGLLKASRNMRSSLGAWIVPTSLIRASWPERVAAGHDHFHETDTRWRRKARQHARQAKAPDRANTGGHLGGPMIGTLNARGQVIAINNSHFRDLNLGAVNPRGDPDEGSGKGVR